MSLALEPPPPGHVLPLCVGCQHRTPDLSHPNPCGRIRWEAHRHVKPTITVDAADVGCYDFVPVGLLAEGILG